MNSDHERNLRLRHVEQLRQLPVDQAPPPAAKLPGKQLHVTPAWISQATNDTLSIIKEAVASGGRGNKLNVTWSVALLTFLESSAVYLRDMNLLAQATAAAKTGQHDHAVDLLRSADAPIQAIANLWDLDYVTLCDLVDDHADGHWWWDGPYAGLFVSRPGAQHSFAGLAFKGTVTTSVAELLVDVAYHPVESTATALPNVHVSSGVYTTLFEPFKTLDGQAPFDYIISQMQTLLASTGTAYDLHVTGHSLGASYATLFHTALLNSGAAAPSQLRLRDLWTFGCPRVGLTDFAALQAELMAAHDGASWRIVDNQDPVTLVPPDPLHPGSETFVHIDTGERVIADGPPERLPSELKDGVTHTGISAILHFKDHLITSYFAAIHATAVKLAQAIAEAA